MGFHGGISGLLRGGREREILSLAVWVHGEKLAIAKPGRKQSRSVMSDSLWPHGL